jgi:hypothetical protein
MVAALAIVAAVIAVGWKLTRRGGHIVTAFLAALVTAGMVGAVTVPLESVVSNDAAQLIYARAGRGGSTEAQAAAARWLKDNSNPSDLIATNAHCSIRRGETCDSRHFWIAALSERTLLVEGWAYTNHANRISVATGERYSQVPFWDKDLLAVNDAVFTSPSAATVERLRRFGVRWLFADRLAGEVSPELMQYVQLRHATADVTIYEIR